MAMIARALPSPQAIPRPHLRLCRAHSSQTVHQLLDNISWLLPSPAVEVTLIRQGLAADAPSFAVIRDDLLNPFLGGNKLRKLDGLWSSSIAPATDVVTCGGLQSSHTLALAAACAQHGKRCHLLVRGERPAVPTGPHLYARLFAHHVEYVSRAHYADRDAMFAAYLQRLHGQQQQQQGRTTGTAAGTASAARTAAQAAEGAALQTVAVVPEGGACAGALLGLIRLTAWLANHSLLAGRRCNIVVDSGTGATATGLALGAQLLGLPWRVTGVMLAAPLDYYLAQQHSLTAAFCAAHAVDDADLAQHGVADRLAWVQRPVPRKFGKVLEGEVAACKAVAQKHGIVLDPMWNLAAWEVCQQLAAATGAAAGSGSGGSEMPGISGSGGVEMPGSSGNGSGKDGCMDDGSSDSNITSGMDGLSGAAGKQEGDSEEMVVMLHTGGMLGLCGLAQRRPQDF